MSYRSATTLIIMAVITSVLLVGCSADGVTVEDAWARPANRGENSAVYFVITNRTSADIDLIDAESDVASIVELHRSMMVDDAMKMVKQEDIIIPAGGELIFKPGDYHVMLMGLGQDLTIGDSFALSLQFEGAPEVSLQVPVKTE